MAAAESYPDDLKYHREHDWARIDGDEAMLGITWFAQDALGELVHYEAPEAGRDRRGRRVVRRGRVGQGRLGRDLAALGRGARGERGGRRRARDRERGSRTATGWLIRIRLSDPAEVDGLLDLGGVPRGAGRAVTHPFLCLTDDDRDAMLATIGVADVEELFADIPEGVRLRRDLDLEPPLSEPELVAHLEELARGTRTPARELSFLGAGIYDHYVPAVVDAVLSRGEFLTAYTPYQPEMSQGVLQAIFEYQTAICELTGMDVSNASGYDGTTVAADACYVARTPPGARRSSSPRRRTRRCGRS